MKLNKTYICFLSLLLTLSSCNYKIIRSGYAPYSGKTESCEVSITKDLSSRDSAQKVGTIKLKDTGFTTNCNEKQALEILKEEACSLDADVIHLVEETRPSFSSSCYRCTAEFYKTRAGAEIKSDADYRDYAIEKRSEDDKRKSQTAFWISFGIGFVIGLLLVL